MSNEILKKRYTKMNFDKILDFKGIGNENRKHSKRSVPRAWYQSGGISRETRGNNCCNLTMEHKRDAKNGTKNIRINVRASQKRQATTSSKQLLQNTTRNKQYLIYLINLLTYLNIYIDIIHKLHYNTLIKLTMLNFLHKNRSVFMDKTTYNSESYELDVLNKIKGLYALINSIGDVTEHSDLNFINQALNSLCILFQDLLNSAEDYEEILSELDMRIARLKQNNRSKLWE